MKEELRGAGRVWLYKESCESATELWRESSLREMVKH